MGTRTYYELIDHAQGVINRGALYAPSLVHILFESEEDAETWLGTLVPSAHKKIQRVGYRAWHPDFLATLHVEFPTRH